MVPLLTRDKIVRVARVVYPALGLELSLDAPALDNEEYVTWKLKLPIRISINDQLGSEEDRLWSPRDQRFLFGASVYETVRVYDGNPFLLGRT
jgi:hypothetical protein